MNCGLISWAASPDGTGYMGIGRYDPGRWDLRFHREGGGSEFVADLLFSFESLVFSLPVMLDGEYGEVRRHSGDLVLAIIYVFTRYL